MDKSFGTEKLEGALKCNRLPSLRSLPGSLAPNLAEQRSAPNPITYGSPASDVDLARAGNPIAAAAALQDRPVHVRLPSHLPQRPSSRP